MSQIKLNYEGLNNYITILTNNVKNICDSLGKFGSVNSIFLYLELEYLKENLTNLL